MFHLTLGFLESDGVGVGILSWLPRLLPLLPRLLELGLPFLLLVGVFILAAGLGEEPCDGDGVHRATFSV